METVISLSSDDSDVEVVGSFAAEPEPLPLTSVRVDVDVPPVSGGAAVAVETDTLPSRDLAAAAAVVFRIKP